MNKKIQNRREDEVSKTTEDWSLTGRMIMEHIQCKIINNAKL
ncbi:hypothetical protein VCR26J2_370191 [Vibrio coralliirubri]|nr:hypothetical protein VCR1J2_200610 [Vibrio coralliirubri]CDT14387.1 hypothetical protein VCR6J2_230311 [Vibrio coralliirubri]CDT74291.1 hypothetical protein VCR8J2_190137 [Vibrio coralliirubri]CDT75700.1 hypothetical protein VCR26J2_370191 [Vibrio coralliirubri]